MSLSYTAHIPVDIYDRAGKIKRDTPENLLAASPPLTKTRCSYLQKRPVPETLEGEGPARKKRSATEDSGEGPTKKTCDASAPKRQQTGHTMPFVSACLCSLLYMLYPAKGIAPKNAKEKSEQFLTEVLSSEQCIVAGGKRKQTLIEYIEEHARVCMRKLYANDFAEEKFEKNIINGATYYDCYLLERLIEPNRRKTFEKFIRFETKSGVEYKRGSKFTDSGALVGTATLFAITLFWWATKTKSEIFKKEFVPIMLQINSRSADLIKKYDYKKCDILIVEDPQPDLCAQDASIESSTKPQPSEDTKLAPFSLSSLTGDVDDIPLFPSLERADDVDDTPSLLQWDNIIHNIDVDVDDMRSFFQRDTKLAPFSLSPLTGDVDDIPLFPSLERADDVDDTPSLLQWDNIIHNIDVDVDDMRSFFQRDTKLAPFSLSSLTGDVDDIPLFPSSFFDDL